MLKSCLLAVSAVFCLALPALAHTTITTSNIESGSILAELPAALSFSFGANVGLAAVSLATTDGDEIALDYAAPKSMEKSFEVPLPVLVAADYVFSWRAVSTDGHVMTGEIDFTVVD